MDRGLVSGKGGVVERQHAADESVTLGRVEVDVGSRRCQSWRVAMVRGWTGRLVFVVAAAVGAAGGRWG